jgi:hypothetical protein
MFNSQRLETQILKACSEHFFSDLCHLHFCKKEENQKSIVKQCNEENVCYHETSFSLAKIDDH